MDDEILACIKEENVKYLQSGQIAKYIFPMERKEAHEKKIAHIIVRVFMMTITPENEVQYLVQKRALTKRGYPGYYTDSASGHVLYEDGLDLGEVKENAMRELEEEFGIPLNEIQEFMFLELNIEEDQSTQEIAYIFFGLVNHDVELRPQREELEIEGSQFYTGPELERLLKEEKTVIYSRKIWEELLKVDVIALFNQEEFIKDNINFKTKTALFIGRFQPLHLGHFHVIKKCLEMFRYMKIGIGSSQASHEFNDPFTSEERKQFITASLEGIGKTTAEFEIVEIPDIFNAKGWVDHVIMTAGKFDVIISNSDWVRWLFLKKGYHVGKKMLFDLKKYNGSRIRLLMRENDSEWMQLVPNEVIQIVKDSEWMQLEIN